ncbi:MAG: DMT family transporter [Gemmatimonadetes bacterium]|nr:DMT family transporter [Gemmatimonadota bacterium]
MSAHIAMLVLVTIWGVNFSVAKEALATIPPLAFNALRFPLAAAVVLVALGRGSGVRLPERGDLARILALGILGNIIYQLCFIYGLANTRAGIASVLLAGTPIMTALLSAARGHERVTGRMWLGVVTAAAGIIFVLRGSGPGEPGENVLYGNLLMVGATMAWAVYTVGSRGMIHKYGAVPVTAWTLSAGTIGIMLLGLPATLVLELRAIPLRAWIAIFYAGAFSIGVAYTLWSYSVRQLGNTRTGVYSNLVPVLALAVAWAWLGERPSRLQLVGAAIIIAGITLAQAVERRAMAIAGRALPP